MKKTLKITTALVGSMLALGVSAAVAQTTVSGNLGLSYFATKNNATANQNKTYRGFGKESQINIQNKGKLNNGMDYAAGFSLEMDGADVTNATAVNGSSVQAQQSENVYIDFISGNTTITIGADHIQNPDAHLANIVGFGYLSADGINGVDSSMPQHKSPYSAYGAGIVQNFPGVGSLSLLYVPNNASGQAVNDIGNAQTKAKTGDGESATEIGFKGSFGVKGLEVMAFKSYSDAQTAGIDNQGTTIGAKYNFGNFTIAAQDINVEQMSATDGAASSTVKGRQYGAAYAVNKDLSVGYTYGKTTKTATTADEIIHRVAAGYNLGPVSLQVQYTDVANQANAVNADGQVLGVYLGTRF
jgi:hypothetical protein